MKELIMPNPELHIFTDRHILRNPALTVLMKLTVDGEFDESRFETALLALKSIHPLLYATVFLADDGKAYYHENAVSQLELHSMKREHKHQWLDVAQTENKRPFDLESGPLARFFVFYDEKDFDILAVVHHMIGDGRAIARLLRDVVKAYARIDMPFQKQRLLSSRDDFPMEAVPTFIVKAFTRNLNKTWSKGGIPRFNENEYQEMFSNYHQLADIGLSYSTINANQLDSLHQACRAHGVTINEAIVTAFILAMREHCTYRKNEEIIIAVPIDIRSQLSFSTDSCLGNFASGITIKSKGSMGNDFWENAIQVQGKLKSKLTSAKLS